MMLRRAIAPRRDASPKAPVAGQVQGARAAFARSIGRLHRRRIKLLLRTTATAWAVQTDDVVTCPEQRRMSGRAVPGTTLADDGHCVQAASLDAGVCVEDAADWRGAHKRRCLPSLAVIGARAASGVPSLETACLCSPRRHAAPATVFTGAARHRRDMTRTQAP